MKAVVAVVFICLIAVLVIMGICIGREQMMSRHAPRPATSAQCVAPGSCSADTKWVPRETLESLDLTDDSGLSYWPSFTPADGPSDSEPVSEVIARPVAGLRSALKQPGAPRKNGNIMWSKKSRMRRYNVNTGEMSSRSVEIPT